MIGVPGTGLSLMDTLTMASSVQQLEGDIAGRVESTTLSLILLLSIVHLPSCLSIMYSLGINEDMISCVSCIFQENGFPPPAKWYATSSRTIQLEYLNAR